MTDISRRDLFGALGRAAGASVALSPLVHSAIVDSSETAETAVDSPVAGTALSCESPSAGATEFAQSPIWPG